MYFGKFIRLAAVVLTFQFIVTACSDNKESSDEEQIENVACEFGNHLFNYELKDAAKLTEPGSRRWISLFASNIDEETIKMVRNQEDAATVDVDSITFMSDTTATAHITVSNFIWTAGMEEKPAVAENGAFSLPMIKQAGKWLVRMGSLQQNGRQSRD